MAGVRHGLIGIGLDGHRAATVFPRAARRETGRPRADGCDPIPHGLGDDIEGLVGSAFDATRIGDGWGNTRVGGAGFDSFAFAARDTVNGALDVLADFPDGLDAVVLQGWNPAALAIVRSGADTIITTPDSGYSTGVIAANSTVARLVDPVPLVRGGA